MLYCNCAKCDGKKDEHFNDILDPENECISRYCADIVFLEDHYEYVMHPEKRKTNADFDLSILGPEEFFKRNHTPHTFNLFKVLGEYFKPNN